MLYCTQSQIRVYLVGLEVRMGRELEGCLATLCFLGGEEVIYDVGSSFENSFAHTLMA